MYTAPQFSAQRAREEVNRSGVWGSSIFNYIILVALFGAGIHYEKSVEWFSKHSLSWLGKILTIIFASIINLMEEVLDVLRFYKDCRRIQSVYKKQNIFKNLSLEDRNEVRKFYTAKVRQLDRAQRVICREASIQVVLQLTLILYQAKFQISKHLKVLST